MDTKTRELLLKLRKSATASFGLKEWTIVLAECGFKVEVTRKEGRSVVQVTIWSPLLTTLVIDKEPSYKAIHFYALPRWVKNDCGINLVEVASIRLGMDTPEVEAKLKDLYVRDLTNTGTCPVCGDNFKRDSSGGMVHHGFIRPGDGYIHGDCFAVGYQPWELSPKGAIDYVAQALVPALESAQAYLERLKDGSITEFTRMERVRGGFHGEKKAVTVTKAANAYEFSRMLDQEISSTVRSIAGFKGSVEQFRTAIANWKLDILPEVKYAGKFKAV